MMVKSASWLFLLLVSSALFGRGSYFSAIEDFNSLPISTEYSQREKLLQPAGPFCITDAPENLTASTPGGVWSGNGITDPIAGTFDPAVAGVGDHIITYVSIAGTETTTIHVDPIVNATITPAGPFCDNENISYLSGASPGGSWSGPGITNPVTGAFDPEIAGAGTHTVQYSVSNGGCSDVDTEDILVYLSPDANFPPLADVCETDPPFNIIPDNLGGVWSGIGITDPMNGTFSPSVSGPGSFMISYSLSDANCTSQLIRRINVDTLVIATITPVGPFCDNDPAIFLTAVDINGTWSGNGITDSLTGAFNPSVAGAGIHTITYEIIAGACEDIDNSNITVLAAPDATINDPGEFCISDPPVNLTAVTPGGVWAGPGITDPINGTFDPSVAIVGANNITYTVSNPNCTAVGSITIFVYNSVVDATITSTGPFCISDGLINMTAISPGGVWSGVGITDAINGVFDPNVAGIGNHLITYDVGNPACFDTDTQTIQVDDTLSAIINSQAPVCESDIPFNFTAANVGGVWSGTGIIDPVNGTFDPAIAGDGVHTITYTIIQGACTNTDNFNIQVDASVDATITPAGPFCETDASENLVAADIGGTWSGTGITDPVNGTFDPAVAGVGIHTITYTITNGTCTDTDTEQVSVFSFPDSDWASIGPFCQFDSPVNIVPVTLGGVFSGAGITDAALGTFNPTVAGVGTHQITYTITNGACVSVTTKPVIVYTDVNPQINPAGPFCSNNNMVILSANPPGGTWSGPGITNPVVGAFRPIIAGPGVHPIVYSISNANCSDSDTLWITVFLSPIAQFDAISDICETDPPFDIIPLNLGGTWSGTGITDPFNGTFDPSVAGPGSHMITYTMTDPNCSSVCVRRFDVDSAVNATITPAGPFCEDDAQQILSAADPGGTWSGTGITDASTGAFNPAIAGPGVHTITYSLSAGACEDTATIDITVDMILDATINPAGPFCSFDPALNLSSVTPGGTWSGTGITDPITGLFDPSVAGSGDHTITYDLTNGACNSQGTTSIHIDAGADATITPVAPICETEPAFNLTAADLGGVWSGTGITDAVNGTFDASIAGIGMHVITYSISNGACISTDTETITVDANPDSSISGAGPFCSNQAAVNLTAVTAGGTWSGTGITDAILGTFNPNVAGAGDHVITYTLVAGACTNSSSITIHVDAEVDATISPVAPICEFEPAFNLTGADPGGVWSGTGITDAVNGTFDAIIAGIGMHVITYTITNGVCLSTDTETITVDANPDSSISGAGPFCSNQAAVNLTALNAGGTWSGTGITDAILGNFNPNVAGAGDHVITYTIVAGACTNSSSITIHVDAEVDATISPVAPICEFEPAFNLTGADPDGVWSGTGITDAVNGTFDAIIAGVGMHVITYTITNGVCLSTDTETITVDANPDSSISGAGPFCSNQAAVNLTAVTAGGTWSGNGITDAILGTFNPNVAGGGDHVITYTLVAGACTNSSTTTIHVDAAVDATISPAGPFCQFDPATNLTAVSAGGTWAGLGITDAINGTFNPQTAGVGIHNITYNITNGLCSDSDNRLITVLIAPDATINNPGDFCSDDPAVNLTAVTPGGLWAGSGITDAMNGTFNPSVALDGANNITYTITSGGCTSVGTLTIFVYDAAVDATITSTGPYCISDGLITLAAVSSGGTWSGVGIVDPANGIFDVSVAGVGNHLITYNVGNPACFDSDSQIIQVDDSISAIINSVAPICENTAAFNFTAANAGGLWSGTGITDAVLGTFNPAIAGDGTHIITYTISQGVCTNIDTFSMVVDASVDATITPAGPFCVNGSATNLVAVSLGGTWAGTGIVNPATGLFHPGVSGVGDHIITYSVVNGTCSDSDTETIHVDALPNTTINAAGPFCENDPAINLTAATPGGLWSGTGITDNILGTFNPSVAGAGSFVITYEITNGACYSSSTRTIVVDDFYNATITPAGPFCVNGSATTLVAASPGGTWSGTGIVNPATGLFHPGISGAGNHIITYSIVNGTCSDSDTETIHVDAFPNTTITAAGPFCESDPAINLTAATPGGLWSGTGITDNVLGTFNPSVAGAGSFVITYEITNGACYSVSTSTIDVDEFYDATITPAGPFCVNGSATTLVAASLGGTWAGTGIVNLATGLFHPGVSGVGNHIITYSTVNGTCSDSDTETIHVDAFPNTTITAAGPFCESDPAINLTAASPGGLWSGTGITDNILGTFNPSVSSSGSFIITYEITNGACYSVSTTTIVVDEFYDATITPAGPFCVNGSATNLVAASLGGTWSGTGIANPATGLFHPGISGVGDHIITYSIANGTCSDSDTETIHVDVFPNTTITAAGPFCESDPAINLTAATPGGLWSGTGITDNVLGTFNPSVAGVGSFVITYEITNGACYSVSTRTIIVDDFYDATITPAGPFCENEAATNLVAASLGGTWSGTGIVNPATGLFHPGVSGVGDHIITYSIVNGACSDSDTETIHVDLFPNTTLSSVGPFCETDAAVDLNEPSIGGLWSGNGITNILTGIFDPSIAGGGTHTITYNVINGACNSSGTTNIIVNTTVDATITDVGPLCETDASITLVAVSPGGTWSGSGIVNSVTGEFNPTIAGPGNHVITYYVENGVCNDTDNTSIVVDFSPVVTILTTGPFCETAGNQLFTSDVAGGVWSGDGIDMTGNFNPSVAGIGMHTITYTVTNGSCVVIETVDITVNQYFDATITSTGPYCFNDTPFNLTSVNPGGVWTGDGTNASGLFSPAVAGVGNHIITYEITNGACYDDDTETITVNSNPDATISGPTDVCLNDPIFNYVAAEAGGTWLGAGIIDAIAGTFDPQVSGDGSFLIVYQITVNGCSSIDFDTLTVHELPIVTISGLNPHYCINDAAQIVNVSPAGGVLTGGSIAGNLFDPQVAGVGIHDITYVYSDINSCSDTAHFTLEVHALPVTSISGFDEYYCLASDTVYPVLLPLGGTLIGSGVNNNMFIPQLAGPGVFTLMYVFEDVFGCSDTSYVTTTVVDYAQIDFNVTQPLCFGDSNGTVTSSVSSAIGPFTYLWSDPLSSVTPDIFNVNSGWYYLSVTDSISCVTVDSIFVDQPNELIVDISQVSNVSCFGLTDAWAIANVTGGVPDYTYLWDDINLTDSLLIENLSIGTYSVIVTDANFCTATDTIIISEPDTLSLSFIDVSNISCYMFGDGEVTVEPSGGTGPYIATWNDPAATIGFTVTNLSPGYVTVTITDAHFCEITDSILISQPDSIYIETTISPVLCTQQLGSVSVSVFGGVAPYDYLWSNGDTLPNLNDLISQNYTLTIHDQNGCVLQSSIDMPHEGSVSLDITQTVFNLCNGDKIAELIASSTDAAVPRSYSWSNYITDSINTNLAAGEYFVTLTDSWGCSGIDSITVEEPEILSILVSSQNILCRGDFSGSASVEIQGGTPAYSVHWQNGNTALNIYGLGAGEIWVTVTDANNCVETGHSVITQPQTGLEIDMSIKQVTCFGVQDGAINAFASGGSPPYLYTWHFDGNEVFGSTLRNIGVGIYNLSVFDRNGCFADTIAQIYQVNSLVATAIAGSTSCQNNSDGYIMINAQGGTEPYTYYWLDIAWNTPIIDSLYHGDYYITVRDSNNCEYSFGPVVVLDSDKDCLKIPAAFSPNGDGYNDEFFIENIQLYPRAVIQIYNRWGQILYEDLGINGFWDGTYNGKPVPNGAYLYNIILNVNDDPRVGTVTVIR